jgi:hypothetical protein
MRAGQNRYTRGQGAEPGTPGSRFRQVSATWIVDFGLPSQVTGSPAAWTRLKTRWPMAVVSALCEAAP